MTDILRDPASLTDDERRFCDWFLHGDPRFPPGGGLLGPTPRPPVAPGRVTRQQRRAAERAARA